MAPTDPSASPKLSPQVTVQMAEKDAGQATTEPAFEQNGNDTDDNESEVLAATKSTRTDGLDMERLGRKQQLIRHFRFMSTVAFTAMATAAWEIGIFLINQGLIDGGRAGLVWSILWNFAGFLPIYLSMAEMASMAPTAGAQYHWVSEFAPARYQKLLSYMTGWTSTMAWQAGNALGVFLTGTLLQTVILINNPTYAYPPWQGALLVIATILIVYVINVYGSRLIPKLQVIIFCLHVTAYLCFIVPIWVNAPHATAKQVFTEFSNGGGWSSLPLAVMAGQLSGIYTQIGVDTAAHISEEVADASKTVPKAMMSVWLINFLLIFPAVVTLCFAMPNLEKALGDPSAYPPVYVLRQSMSDGWITVVLLMIILLLIWSNVSYLTAVTRDLFAFSRDGGLPFSNWISKIHPTRRIPEHAVQVTSIVSFLLSLIYIGSPVAFYAITSLLTVALLQCYMFSIGSVLWRRLFEPQSLPPAHFSLGKWGVPVNTAAVIYSLWAFFWSFWPQVTPVTARGFNWASVIFVGVLLIAAAFYLLKARRVYTGPVVLVKKMG